jgi:hypothetical protein
MQKGHRQSVKDDIEARVGTGESKTAIFAGYEMTADAVYASRVLAMTPTLANRRRLASLQWLLYALAALLAIADFWIDFIPVALQAHNPVVLFTGGILYLAIFWLLVRHNPFGYLMVAAMAIRGLYGALRFFGPDRPPNAAGIALLALYVVLAVFPLVLQHWMLPKTGFLLTPKRAAFGRPEFED